MDYDYRDRQKKSYTVMRVTYDITMAILLLGMAVAMFFGPYFKIQKITEIDTSFRYLFGGICTLYGGFRLYRGFRKDY
jgi:uncharacterized membrane protein